MKDRKVEKERNGQNDCECWKNKTLLSKEKNVIKWEKNFLL